MRGSCRPTRLKTCIPLAALTRQATRVRDEPFTLSLSRLVTGPNSPVGTGSSCKTKEGEALQDPTRLSVQGPATQKEAEPKQAG